jgi:hypothetical protein
VLNVLVVSCEIAGKYWYSPPHPFLWISYGITRVNGAGCISVENSYNIVSQTLGHGLVAVHEPFFAYKVLAYYIHNISTIFVITKHIFYIKIYL